MKTSKGNSAGVMMIHIAIQTVRGREIFLILQIVCKILGQRLLKTSQLPDLNTCSVRHIS